MTLICDTGPLVAAGDLVDPHHPAVARILREDRGPFVVPSPVLAEVDYIRGERLGRDARLAFLEDVAARRFVVEDLEPGEYSAVLEVERRYEAMDLGLADASVVVLARRLRTRRILTFDERHFRSIRPLQGGTFTLLPADD